MRKVRDCSVAVVGGAGFLGSHLVDHLVEDRDCQVLVLDNLCAGRREFVHKDAEFQHLDITGSEEALRIVFKDFGARFVLNYAALPYVPDSYKHPKRAFAVNLNGAINVINAAQEAGCEAVLQVSSAEVYGDAGQSRMVQLQGDITDPDSCTPTGKVTYANHKIDELGKVTPHSSYGASKAAVDAYCQVAWRERRTPVIALRQFNCCGERETHPYVIPEIIKQLDYYILDRSKTGNIVFRSSAHEGGYASPTVKLGNDSSRDFIYAGDAVRIAVELLERGQFGETYNLGSEESIGIYDLARRISKLMGFVDVRVERDEARARPWEIWHLRSCNDKLYSVLRAEKWRKLRGGEETVAEFRGSMTPLDEGLRRTIRWYEEQGRKWPWEK